MLRLVSKTLSRLLIALMAMLVAAPAAYAVSGFGDVEGDDYFAQSVQWMVDNNLTVGVSPTCFGPHQPVTRGQVAIFLWRYEGRKIVSGDHPFNDVSGEVDTAVRWMYDAGLTNGTSATTYSPNDILTRGQAAAIFHRHAGSPSASEPLPFTDVVRPWQIEPIRWMAENGITTGTSPTTFSPEATVTRAQFATFLWRRDGSDPVAVDADSPYCAYGTPSGLLPVPPDSHWPGPDTTGVVNASILQDSGSIDVTQDGAVIENLRVTGSITVSADNVTIRNVYIDATSLYGIHVRKDTRGTQISDVTIVGGNVEDKCDVGIVFGYYEARRIDISRCGDGVRAGTSTVFEDSWIHDMRDDADDHSDGVQSPGGSNIVIRGNNIEMSPFMTSAMLLHANGWDLVNVLVEDNRVMGGGYSINIKERTDDVENVIVRNNVWVRDSYNFGPITGDALPTGSAWSGNRFDDGVPIER